jgi:hypothetical protein
LLHIKKGDLDHNPKSMKRYTKKSIDGYCIDTAEIQLSQGDVKGNVIDRLAEFENFYEDLVRERNETSRHLDQLRVSGSTKSVTFRQLFANKISIDMIIERVNRFIHNEKD